MSRLPALTPNGHWAPSAGLPSGLLRFTPLAVAVFDEACIGP